MTQVITLHDLVNAAQDYFDRGQLTAQLGHGCVYSDGATGRCVIGAAMSQETIDIIRAKGLNGATISLISDNRRLPRIIAFPDEDTLDIATQLQVLHDDWIDEMRVSRTVLDARFCPTEDGLRAALAYIRKKLQS